MKNAKSIVLFAGTRPEIIKMAPIIRELRAREKVSNGWKSHFCFSGQHVEIALPFIKYFEIEPDSRLELMDPGQSLGQLTSTAALQMDSFLSAHTSAVATLVQGDTTTAFMAALSSFYHRIPVGHVEAGLRTDSIAEPFPEELNRRMITQMATWNYAPTIRAQNSLTAENVKPSSIEVTGNTGIDAFLWTASRVQNPQTAILRELEGRRLVLVTIHRRENLGERLENILEALRRLSHEFSEIQFILPVHPNPKVHSTVHGKLSDIPNFQLLPPLSYPELVWTMKNAELILTDSGGIQEEAPSLLKPVLVLRESTERPEAVEYGTSKIVGSETEKIVSIASRFLSGSQKIGSTERPNPFGDGRAASRIADHLLRSLNLMPPSGKDQ